MRLGLIWCCMAPAALAQYLPTGGIPIGAGGSNPQFVQAKGTDTGSASTSIAQAITVGGGAHQLHVVASNQNSGDVINTTISDTANSNWYPVCPAGQMNCAILSAIVTNGGSGYTVGPTVNATPPAGGCTTLPSISATASGGQVTLLSVGTMGSCNGIPTLSFSGGGGTGAQGRISAVALANNGFQGLMMWDAFNVTAGSDTITVTTATSQLSYTAISVVELSGTSTLDGSAGNSSSFTSTANLATTQSADVVVCTARGESLSNGWSPGNIAGGAATIPTNGVTSTNSIMATEYRKLSSTVSSQTAAITDSVSPVATSIICGAYY